MRKTISKNKKIFFDKKNKGFTLLEALVSVFVFSIVMGITANQFVSFVAGQRRIFASQAVIDDVRFALEAMGKEMRTGTNFYATTSPSSQIKFNNSEGESITYRLNNNIIEISRDNEQSFAPLSGTNIQVSKMQFYLSGENTNDNAQPKITIVIEAKNLYTIQESAQTQINIQTTISQRNLDS